MKRLILAVAALALCGTAAAEPRGHTNFDGVASEGRFRVEIAVGEGYSVDVSGPDAERIRTRIHNGTLKIEPRSRPWFGERRYNALVRVTAPSLDTIAAARGVTVTATGLYGASLSLAAAMGADLTASGECGMASVAASMGANINAEHLLCSEVEAAVSMGADAHVFASLALDAAASMGGTVRVSGNPAHTDIAASMGGEVSRR